MWNVFVVDPISKDSFLVNEQPLPLHAATKMVDSMCELGLLFLLSRSTDSLLPLSGHVLSFEVDGLSFNCSLE